MKIKTYILFVCFCYLMVSCVGVKKYKALQLEKTKIENTFLQTKTDLAVAKRELNKFKDVSTLSTEAQTSKIVNLNQDLDACKTNLEQSEKALITCQNEKAQLNLTYLKTASECDAKLKPLEKVQNELKSHNRALKALQEKILTAFEEVEEVKMNILLDKEELILTFDHKYLFSSTGRSLSTNGKMMVYTLAGILETDENILIDIIGHSNLEGNILENWKTSSRKPLSLIYTLQSKGIASERMNGRFYGEHNILSVEKDAESIMRNNRTEVILHYPNQHLLKLIPIK